MTALMISQGIGITPDRYAFVLLLPALFIHKTRQFLLDWTPFLFILISYDFMRSFADKVNPIVNFTPMINFDKFFFGRTPTQILQGMFYRHGNLQWYDYTGAILYFMHFVLPLAFGFILWTTNRNRFRQFTLGLLMLSYAGWLTYLIFPAAPPWLASQQGYLPGVTKVTNDVVYAFPQKFDVPTIYGVFDANLVAAVPSMHAAYPFLILLFCLYFYKWKGLIFLPYVIAISVGVIYLGEHYFFDVLLGISYASFFFVLTRVLVKHHSKWLNYAQEMVLGVKSVAIAFRKVDK